jgi:hypothetical protein
VNARFARQIIEVAEPNDLVWVHDYHLALVPGLLRAAHPGLRVGFFLHVPFPAPDIFRVARRPCSSAWIASTTRRASRAGSSPSISSCASSPS